MEGTLSFIDCPDDKKLPRSTPLPRHIGIFSYGKIDPNAIKAPFPLGKDCPIKYAIYVIKENRAYDQVFGDLKEGNGDARYCIFP